MVLPDHLSHYAGHGHVAPIKAWLNEGGDVNERDRNQNTMLIICTGTPYTRGTASQIELARLLIERGADANICASEDPPALGLSPLHYACDQLVDHSADMVALLLKAKANVHCRAQPGPDDSHPADTPLGMTLLGFPSEGSAEEHFTAIPRIVTMLLRAGASIDAVSDERTAEMELREAEDVNPDLRDSDAFVQTKNLVHAVRAAGTWKAFCRRDHKEILRLRSLITRGRARERLAATPAIKFILRRADNGVLWNILSFWRATE